MKSKKRINSARSGYLALPSAERERRDLALEHFAGFWGRQEHFSIYPHFMYEAAKLNGLGVLQAAAGPVRKGIGKLPCQREVVLEAVKQNGLALEYAPARFLGDRGIVLEAVQKNGLMLKHAQEPLKRDFAIVLAAVKQHGGALKYAPFSPQCSFLIAF